MCPEFYTIRKIIFWEEEWLVVGGGRPLLPEILGQQAPLARNHRFPVDIRS